MFRKILLFQKLTHAKYHHSPILITLFFNDNHIKFFSNTLLSIFIILQIMCSLQDANQNSENLGMTQGAKVNKCITIDPHKNK